MNTTRRKELLEPLCHLAHRAGIAILEVYSRDDLGVEHKDDDSPLTQADRAAHHILAAGLAELAPDIPLLSEEGRAVPFEERRHWERYWLIDPLDGTKEFIKRNGEFTVNIALMEHGRPVLGVVYAPVLDRCYYGALDVGAWLGTAQGTEALRTRPVASPMNLVVSRSHRSGATETLLERLPAHETTSMASSLKFCLVAEGAADLYPRFGPTSEWDTAAAQAVVEAAGGRVTDLALQPLPYNGKESLLNSDFLVVGDPDYDWGQYLEGFTVEPR
ncbi:3'(2'),5'-bisphosphate nucleotidase CysQ [Alkalilimnicola sp. S0819]|uniref:3'(2'),5'-bisphosphate nucleotidase CysQ n=1 Tax=Alkalilimnicola sp. S0819 TaxID=2613922 RepID=UPI0012616031|nr:3'(2'),5'-bisphosphate nucleotidase CysQ [Alkalilimnicola sp. S0819]KAB7622984.1 3'(2'),5'-bisphosphate nucleotidase CysQ [Alkalilimnicola sp. S0819]MPQ17093.1 3'(2'),5'-bisphosphate nucleotidase CysQ [Alkalilimnicola sp. S0819]